MKTLKDFIKEYKKKENEFIEPRLVDLAEAIQGSIDELRKELTRPKYMIHK